MTCQATTAAVPSLSFFSRKVILFCVAASRAQGQGNATVAGCLAIVAVNDPPATFRSDPVFATLEKDPAFHEALAKLWARGCALDLAALWQQFQPIADPREAKKPAVSIPLCGANYGKPYPPAQGVCALPPPNPEKAPAGAGASGGWLEAYQQAQRETLEAHAAWQKSMTETHHAFLKTMERAFSQTSSPQTEALPLAPSYAAPPVVAFEPVP